MSPETPVQMSSSTSDIALLEVAEHIKALDPNGTQLARVFRETFDQLYDGQRTGRYRVDQLMKTEKTGFGTFIEINLQEKFSFPDGEKLDYRIADHEVDCKFSFSSGWMIPPECFNEIALLAWADDSRSQWSLGLIRASEENLRGSTNRDGKTGLNKHGRSKIHWLFQEVQMPPNILLKIPRETVDKIMSQKSGQQRVNELFRSVQDERITRNVVATVAKQKDYMKRVRENGGARTLLAPEGITIFSGDYLVQADAAEARTGVRPLPGEFIATKK